MRPKFTKHNPPHVDWWECDDCDFLFTTYAEEGTARADCPRCDQPGILVLADIKLVCPAEEDPER